MSSIEGVLSDDEFQSMYMTNFQTELDDFLQFADQNMRTIQEIEDDLAADRIAKDQQDQDMHAQMLDGDESDVMGHDAVGCTERQTEGELSIENESPSKLGHQEQSGSGETRDSAYHQNPLEQLERECLENEEKLTDHVDGHPSLDDEYHDFQDDPGNSRNQSIPPDCASGTEHHVSPESSLENLERDLDEFDSRHQVERPGNVDYHQEQGEALVLSPPIQYSARIPAMNFNEITEGIPEDPEVDVDPDVITSGTESDTYEPPSNIYIRHQGLPCMEPLVEDPSEIDENGDSSEDEEGPAIVHETYPDSVPEVEPHGDDTSGEHPCEIIVHQEVSKSEAVSAIFDSINYDHCEEDRVVEHLSDGDDPACRIADGAEQDEQDEDIDGILSGNRSPQTEFRRFNEMNHAPAYTSSPVLGLEHLVDKDCMDEPDASTNEVSVTDVTICYFDENGAKITVSVNDIEKAGHRKERLVDEPEMSSDTEDSSQEVLDSTHRMSPQGCVGHEDEVDMASTPEDHHRELHGELHDESFGGQGDGNKVDMSSTSEYHCGELHSERVGHGDDVDMASTSDYHHGELHSESFGGHGDVIQDVDINCSSRPDTSYMCDVTTDCYDESNNDGYTCSNGEFRSTI